jgi:hypothetical protein
MSLNLNTAIINNHMDEEDEEELLIVSWAVDVLLSDAIDV